MKILFRFIVIFIFAAALLVTFLAAPWLDNLARRVHRKLGFPAQKFGVEIPPRPTARALPTPTASPVPTATPVPTPEPPSLIRIPRQELNTAQLWTGVTANRTLLLPEGGPASQERLEPQSYVLDMTFTNTLPRAAKTVEDFQLTNPKLVRVVKDFETMLSTARVSPYFDALYEEKVKMNRQNLSILNRLVTRHNFYDCDTILDLQHPRTRRRAVLIQADMDVVTDGTDPERTMEYDTSSPTFQPMTSYGWARRSRTPENPLIPRYRKLIEERRQELNAAGTTAERKTVLRNSIAYLERVITDLQSRSYLVAHADPFIVIPLSMRGQGAPEIGDYAVVIHEDRAFPAIVGEYGPREKIGEASLRICSEIDPNISGLRRPVSDLAATYIIFPGTADKPFRRPDLELWHSRVQKFVDEIGGLSVPLHMFEDILATPSPSPSPEPTPTPEPSPVVTPTPESREGAAVETPTPAPAQ